MPERAQDRPLNADLAGRLRAHMAGALLNNAPLMMIANLVNALVVFVTLYGREHSTFLILWTGALWFVAAMGLVQSRSARGQHVTSVSRRGLGRIEMHTSVVAVIWAILPIVMFSGGDYETRIIIGLVTVGMVGGGVMAVYTVPQAMNSWVGILSAGALVALVNSGKPVDFALAVLLACYAVSLLKAGSTLSRTFRENFITAQKNAEKSETIALLLRDFSAGASDWLWETDRNGRFVVGKARFETALGNVIQGFFGLSGEGEEQHAVRVMRGADALLKQMAAGKAFTDLEICAHSDGNERWIRMAGKPLTGRDGTFRGYRGVASDITEAKKAEQRIAFLAHNDALTGLVNRTNFAAGIEQQAADRATDGQWAVMYLDLDGFKAINDTKGHQAGDKILLQVAARLKKAVSDQDLVARLGGDEFAILCRSAATPRAITAVAEKLVETVSAPYQLDDDGRILGLGVSIGIAIGGRDGNTPQTLLHNADLALYRAKSHGKGTYRFYEIEMDDLVRERRMLEQDLRHALENGEFTLAYQPLLCAEKGRTTGFEALIRWNSATRGNVGPADFIPVAERIGIISDIGDWVLENACREACGWSQDLQVAVNLSPQQFHEGRIVSRVAEVLERTGLKPSRLELEITESMFIDNTDEVLACLKELKAMGVSIALDDFGTGYSSLSYLLKFPFDKLKIDRSFISAINEDMTARNVLEAIARLGTVLNLKVTAEGVENMDQVKALEALACTQFQGYLFSKPLGNDEIAPFLLSEQTGRSALATGDAADSRRVAGAR